MKQKMKTIVYFYIVAFVFLCALFFLLPLNRDASLWMTFFFSVISVIIGGILTYYAFSKGDSAKSRLYGFPLFTIGYKYTGTQLLFCIIVFMISYIITIPVWIPIVLSVVIISVFLIGMISGDLTRDIVDDMELKTKNSVSNWSEIKAIAGKALAMANVDIKKDMEKLHEKIKYSDPVSSEGENEIEIKIKDELNSLVELLAGNDMAVVIQKIQEVNGLVERRNQICKEMK